MVSSSQWLAVTIYDDAACIYDSEVALPVLLGRQDAGEPGSVALLNANRSPAKLVVADTYSKAGISRKHVLIESGGGEACRITNQSSMKLFVNDQSFDKAAVVEFRLPFSIRLGPLLVRCQDATEDPELPTLAHSTRDMTTGAARGQLTCLLASITPALTQSLLVSLQQVLDLLQQPIANEQYFERVMGAMADLLDLDNAAILLLEHGEWKPSSRALLPPDWQPSKRALQKMCNELATVRRIGSLAEDSVTNLASLVASPILDATGRVIGALYGDRLERSVNDHSVRASKTEITEVEAMIVDMLATAVATNLVRREQEREVMKSRLRFEQFFTPALADELQRDETLLECKECDVTVLVCDVRGFSTVSESAHGSQTLAWLSDIMDECGQCVLQSRGVLVDQIGDELLAMWGAPQACPDHPHRALSAIFAMQRMLPVISDRWREVIGQPTEVGFGLHTGAVIVGNTGSKTRFRYAPFGEAVNIASRLQGATKYFRRELIVSEASAAGAPPECRRRLTSVMVANMQQPIAVYDIVATATDDWQELKSGYEQALADFEAGNFLAAFQRLAGLLERFPNDYPAELLLSRTFDARRNGPEASHPAWRLPGK